jgi:hypothetical protein
MSLSISLNLFCLGERTGPAVRVIFEELEPFTTYNCSGTIKVSEVL